MTVFEVIGGYGATGSAVASELRKRGGEVLIGGRDAVKGVRVDVLDARSLDDSCRGLDRRQLRRPGDGATRSRGASCLSKPLPVHRSGRLIVGQRGDASL